MLGMREIVALITSRFPHSNSNLRVMDTITLPDPRCDSAHDRTLHLLSLFSRDGHPLHIQTLPPPWAQTDPMWTAKVFI